MIDDCFYKNKSKFKYICLMCNVILIILIIGILFIDCHDVYQVSLIEENNNYIVYVPYNEVMKVKSNHELIMNNEYYNYSFIKIDEEIYNMNNISYQKVYLDINNIDIIENLIVEVKIVDKKIKLYQKIIKLL